MGEIPRGRRGESRQATPTGLFIATPTPQVQRPDCFLGEICDCLIHPETAAEHGIADGQQVRVFNKAGEIAVTAKVDPTMLRGVCSIPHGHKDANINNLTSTYDMDPLGGMAHYSAVPIQIETA